MRKVAILLMAVIALVFSTTLDAIGDTQGSAFMSSNHLGSPPRRSRFLASLKANSKKCGIDPLLCLAVGSTGPDCCNGSCVDTMSDVFNCGHCGKICKYTESCCGGKCVDLAYDKRHCGQCFNRCTKRCFYGLCNYA